MRVLLLLVGILLAPAALGQAAEPIDARIALSPDAPPQVDAPGVLVRLEDATPGERYAFNLTLTQDHTTFDVRMRGFDVERPRQMVPSLVVPDTEYPLFYEFPHERVWEVDSPARIAHVAGSANDVVLRLGIPGPRDVTLLLERDVTPPTFELGRATLLTHFGFLQNTTTGELALADLQVRKAGTEAWIRNPTPEYHFIQRFPIQGLDPDTEYETRFLFTDWAGNTATSDVQRIRTPPRPAVATPVVTPVEPAPNATVNATGVVIRARIELPEGALAPNGISLFLDKRPVAENLRFEGGELQYTIPSPLAPGLHTVSVEATSDGGGRGVASWKFEVAGAKRAEAPFPAGALFLAALGALCLFRRR